MLVKGSKVTLGTSMVVGVLALSACGHATAKEGSSRQIIESPERDLSVANNNATACDTLGRESVVQWGTDGELVGDFSSTVAEAIHWEANSPVGTPPVIREIFSNVFADTAPAANVDLCFFDGSFNPPLTTPPGYKPGAYSRVVVYIWEGKASLYNAGSPDDLPMKGL